MNSRDVCAFKPTESLDFGLKIGGILAGNMTVTGLLSRTFFRKQSFKAKSGVEFPLRRSIGGQVC